MTPEERDIIGRFIARVGGAQQGSAFSSSVPATQSAPLPPVDPEADRFIGEQFAAIPAARYRMTQMAFVQEAALTEAQNRIKRLEYELSQARAQAQAQPQPSRGLFGGLFGGGGQPQQQSYQPQYAPPPQQAYAPGGYQPGMFQGGGSGFFGSALRTAAGVAGGVLAADAISSMFSPHEYGGFGGGFGGGGFGGGGFGGGGFGGGEVVNETIVNNYGPQDGGGGSDPWAGGGMAAPDASAGDPWSGGGEAAPDASAGDAWSGGGVADDSGGGWDGGGGGDDSGSF
jgi:hypothetical protein